LSPGFGRRIGTQIGVRARFLVFACLSAAAPLCAQERVLELGGGETLRYRLITAASESALETATRLLRHLAEGDLAAAAALSNAPERRYAVLRDYRDSVGQEEFKRVFARYLAPENRLLAEAAIGSRHLLIWNLAEAGNHLAGQYYVQLGDRFLLDDVPNEERSKLGRVLAAYRNDAAR